MCPSTLFKYAISSRKLREISVPNTKEITIHFSILPSFLKMILFLFLFVVWQRSVHVTIEREDLGCMMKGNYVAQRGRSLVWGYILALGCRISATS
jgi:hypothetical protein